MYIIVTLDLDTGHKEVVLRTSSGLEALKGLDKLRVERRERRMWNKKGGDPVVSAILTEH